MRTVLIVEDDALMRDLLGRILESGGYRAVLASDGLEALNVLEYLRPNVVLLDLMMPRMDGGEFLARMRRTEAGGVPVVVMTALDQGPVIDRVRQIGIQGHFVKARTNFEELFARVEELANAASSGGDGIAPP